jgi:DNA-binding NarL/FixJ family response regulator
VSEQRRAGQGYLRLLDGTADGESRDADGTRHGERSEVVGGRYSVRVLIAHARALVRAGYRAVLESEERIAVVAEATSTQQAVELAARTRPDVVLLDLGPADEDEARTTERTASRLALSSVPVLMMVDGSSDQDVFRALLAGAVGILRRDAGPDELIGAVHALARGDAVLPAGAMRRLLGELPPERLSQRSWPAQLEELTGREREVVGLVAKGLSNSEIAAVLVVSPKTAKTHVSRAMIKLGARHRAQLVVLAYESGLVLPSADPTQRDDLMRSGHS